MTSKSIKLGGMLFAIGLVGIAAWAAGHYIIGPIIFGAIVFAAMLLLSEVYAPGSIFAPDKDPPESSNDR